MRTSNLNICIAVHKRFIVQGYEIAALWYWHYSGHVE